MMTTRITITAIACAGSLLTACGDTPSDPGTPASAAQALKTAAPHDGCRIDDSLFVGDRGVHDTVERFDANDGAYLGPFVTHQSGGLRGPSGLIFNKRGNGNAELLVVNQNSGTTLNSEVLRYDGEDGSFLGRLVPESDPNAPFAGRGMVLGKQHVLYIADQGDPSAVPPKPGRVPRFDERTGTFLGDLDTTGFTGVFRPRDLVFGPDGHLYVNSFPQLATDNGGFILRFEPTTGSFENIVVEFPDVNRPGGLVFGPDERLYVISSRTSTNDTDKIAIFAVDDGHGTLVDHIDLDQVGQPRTVGTAMIFGPGGGLFITITGTGAVRRYDVQAKTFVDFVPPTAQGGPLVAPFYLTFRNTDPATLAYKPKGKHCPKH
jgi:hypothetical protein